MLTTFDEFLDRCLGADDRTLVPVTDALLADTDTPVSVFLKVRDESSFACLLESVEGGEHLARYSFIGVRPFVRFVATGRRWELCDADARYAALLPDDAPVGDPLAALKAVMSALRPVEVDGLPRLSAGAVGYFGFETVQLAEPSVPVRPPDPDGPDVPDIHLLFFDTLLAFDGVQRRLVLIAHAPVGPDVRRTDRAALRAIYDEAVSRLNRLRDLLRVPLVAPLTLAEPGEVVLAPSANQTQPEFESRVKQAQAYIRAGDIFQVVLSQRLSRPLTGDPFDAYRVLRTINPSPYLYYLQLGDTAIVGASPELLVRVDRGVVETRPIAGTIRRGATETEDDALGQTLLADEKERAEHLMLVDLGRNDLGRISLYRTVEVTEFMQLERYSHLTHLVSHVRGRLDPALGPIDALYACFPAGTLSGAPKIRAMEIIAELEPVRRGVYGGAIGYLDFSGNLDSCIAIRTLVVQRGRVTLQAGAGIVADSVPAREYQETLEKLGAGLRTLEMLGNRNEAAGS